MKFLAAFMFLLPMAFGTQQTQTDMNIQADKELLKTNEEMNKLYAKIIEEYKNDLEFVQKFKKAQTAWLAFRDAHLDALYPHKDERGYYGSVFPMCNSIALNQLTKERIQQLRQWADHTEEGNVCAGSIKFKDRKK